MKYWSSTGCLLCILLLVVSGCVSAPEEEPRSPDPPPATGVPIIPPVESPVIIVPPELAGIPITLTVNPDPTENALYFSFEMNTRQRPGQIPAEGYSLLCTFFTYNIDQMPPGYAPEDGDDLRASGMPYKSRTIMVYPGNIITHYEQVPERGWPVRLFDVEAPYVYGLIIERRGV